MKKHEIIKRAYDEYPKGTKFHWPNDSLPKIVESSGEYVFMADIDGQIMLADVIDKDVAVWNGKDWAEIVNPKIAVKVENEKERDLLEIHFKEKGWDFGFRQFPLVKFYDDSANGYSGNPIEKSVCNAVDAGYKVLSFSDFSKEHNIKSPLIKSEDGVWLYEGDEYYHVYKDAYGISEPKYSTLSKDKSVCVDEQYRGKTHFPFKLKQSALEWIEAHKPKTIDLDCGIVDKDGLKLNRNYTFLEKWEIENALKAIKELS